MLSYKYKNEHDQLAHQALGESAQFIKAVTQLADKREVLANEDIYSKNGIKLVSNGTQLSGKFYDHLVAHKLLKPIEQSLSMADVLDSENLVSLAYEKARRVPLLVPVLEHHGLFERLQRLFCRLKIPSPLALKLSVMQDGRPKLFQHSLIVAMLCVVFGMRGKLKLREMQALVLAGIFHDIGELCIDPALLATGHYMDNDECRYLYTHPITAFLMLRDFSEIPLETAIAVWKHHERLDGRGYPYGLQSDEIDKISRYLAVAEFVAALLEKNGADSRISMKLRLNLHKFDSTAVGIMCALFDGTRVADTQLPDNFYLMTYLTKAGKLLEDWVAFRNTLSSAVIKEISYFDERVDDLRMMVLEPGYDLCRLQDLLPDEKSGNSEIRQELMVLLEELSWQLNEITRVFERKLSDNGWSLPTSRREDFLKWMMQVREFTSH